MRMGSEDVIRRWPLSGVAIAGWREEAGFLLYHFPTWAKARAMHHWIDRSGIASRPMPAPFAGPQLCVGPPGSDCLDGTHSRT
jgi:hypothetical protein